MALDTSSADPAAPTDAALAVAIFHPHGEASWSLWLHRQVEHLGLRPSAPLRTLAAALVGPIGADFDALHARLRDASPPRWRGGTRPAR